MRLVLVSVKCKHYVWLDPFDVGEKNVDCLNCTPPLSDQDEYRVTLETLDAL